MMSDFVYTISRHAATPEDTRPGGQTADGWRYDASRDERPPWFLGLRCAEGLGELSIFGGIHDGKLEEALAILEGATSARIHIFDCSGGCTFSAGKLCAALRRIGRQNVSCSVVGQCSSAAIDLVCCSGFVTARSDARFLIHAPRVEILRRDDGLKVDTLLDKLDAGYESLTAILGQRLENPERFLTGADFRMNATEALEAGIVDEIA